MAQFKIKYSGSLLRPSPKAFKSCDFVRALFHQAFFHHLFHHFFSAPFRALFHHLFHRASFHHFFSAPVRLVKVLFHHLFHRVLFHHVFRHCSCQSFAPSSIIPSSVPLFLCSCLSFPRSSFLLFCLAVTSSFFDIFDVSHLLFVYLIYLSAVFPHPVSFFFLGGGGGRDRSPALYRPI